MEEEEIISRIREVYPDATVEIDGADCNFELRVSSSGFEDMRLLQRQKSILAIFSNDIKTGKLHALGVKAKTPDEWAKTSSNLVQISM